MIEEVTRTTFLHGVGFSFKDVRKDGESKLGSGWDGGEQYFQDNPTFVDVPFLSGRGNEVCRIKRIYGETAHLVNFDTPCWCGNLTKLNYIAPENYDSLGAKTFTRYIHLRNQNVLIGFIDTAVDTKVGITVWDFGIAYFKKFPHIVSISGDGYVHVIESVNVDAELVATTSRVSRNYIGITYLGKPAKVESSSCVAIESKQPNLDAFEEMVAREQGVLPSARDPRLDSDLEFWKEQAIELATLILPEMEKLWAEPKDFKFARSDKPVTITHNGVQGLFSPHKNQSEPAISFCGYQFSYDKFQAKMHLLKEMIKHKLTLETDSVNTQ